MAECIIDRMASDLGLYCYKEEARVEFERRVAYSAISSWLKTITMDQPVGSKEAGLFGVSRRYLYERSRLVLESLCRMYPELAEWFHLSAVEDHPVVLIRTRLLRHGDLLNEGFNTNVALTHPYGVQITSGVETVYGQILDKDLEYAGIATIRHNNIEVPKKPTVGAEEWLTNLLKDVWWSTNFPDTGAWQYFDPSMPVPNNYSAWQDTPTSPTQGVLLSRTVVNKNSYEYYLIKSRGRLLHRIDPFLQEQGFHRRIMYALRAAARNNSVARVSMFTSHVNLRLSAYLPADVETQLQSYAWPSRDVYDRLYWTMSPAIWNYVATHIENIGIKTEEVNNG